MHITESEAYTYALRKLSRADTTAHLLYKALVQKGFRNEEINKVISYFKSKGYLNDEKFAANYILKHFKKGKKGPRLLYFELRSRGIKKELCSILINEIFTVEQELIIIRQIMKQDKEKNARIKSAAKLARRGFRHSSIKHVLNNYCD